MLEQLSEHDLLLFWAQFTLLLAVARGMGHLSRRVGQPPVVGELLAGLLIGPSVFGRLLPEQAAWLFPGGTSESAPIMTVAWLGVALLLIETGMETDLGLLRRLGRQAAFVSLGSLVVPLVLGFVVGWWMPTAFLGEQATRFTFAAFVAVALSISALPVVARILTGLGLMRRDIGQVTVAAAMTNDLIGWILLGALAGIVTAGGFALGQTMFTIVAIVLFLVFSLTVGQRLVDAALRVSRQGGEGVSGTLTVSLLVVLLAATFTQAIGVEAVLGAFIAGIVLGRSRYQRREVRRAIELMAAAVFAPIFFATAGISVDLGAIASPSGLFWAVTVVAVATVTKLAGSYLGARAGGMTSRDGIALGIGLNARGAMEIVLATIALSLGVFSQAAYSIIVLMAIVTSLAAPPLLRLALRDLRPRGDEAERLEREDVLATSVIASTSRALLPTRGGENANLAASALDLLLRPEASVTVLSVHAPGQGAEEDGFEETLEATASRFTDHAAERRRRTAEDPAEAILAEAGLGYDLVGVGLTEGFRDTRELSNVLQQLILRTEVPLLLVRHGVGIGPEIGRSRRILVPVSGVRSARAAEEVGAIFASRLDADLDLVHVVDRTDRSEESQQVTATAGGRQPSPGTAGGAPSSGPTSGSTSGSVSVSLLEQAVERCRRFGVRVSGSMRAGTVTPATVLAAGEELDSDLLVVSTRSRAVEGRPFLGHGAEYLLEHAPQTVVAVIFPPERPDGH